jgi:hypothetical protein
VLILGEVHTGFVRNSRSLSQIQAAEVLNLVAGERVLRSERPIDFTLSPDLLAGVDCLMPTASRSRVRGVGTVLERAMITGGHALQV